MYYDVKAALRNQTGHAVGKSRETLVIRTMLEQVMDLVLETGFHFLIK
jgi:hypothetical protein